MKKILESFNIREKNYGTWIGIEPIISNKKMLDVFSPVDGKHIAKVEPSNKNIYVHVVKEAKKAFEIWRKQPAPFRGNIIRQIGEEFRKDKKSLGKLVAYEMGKSLQEGYGEVQEIIDICDFAVGLSRQLHGLIIQSERPLHRMYEQWHPLGLVGIISAFNFPAAVWGWNSVLAWLCGNVCIWKPSEKTPLTALACQQIVARVLKKNKLPQAISCLIIGEKETGEWLAKDKNINLVSATGSCQMGKSVAETVAQRFGKSLLELGGNNAMIISQNADLNIAIPAVFFGALGTAGQRCTSTRRIIVHKSIAEVIKEKLIHAYKQIKIGNPLDESNLIGPLVDQQAVQNYLNGIEECKKQGGNFFIEGGILEGEDYKNKCYVRPCVAEVKAHYDILQKEIFAPILYLITYTDLSEAIEIQNNVPQGLSSAIMTRNLQEAELFLSHIGSDCGIANVNIGTSGAEIGGAFGGEKETGGGRESGSDAWKNYMRRQTVTINYSQELPLAQGIKFNL